MAGPGSHVSFLPARVILKHQVYRQLADTTARHALTATKSSQQSAKRARAITVSTGALREWQNMQDPRSNVTKWRNNSGLYKGSTSSI